MYPILAKKIHSSECKRIGGKAPKGLYVWDVFAMATSGAHLPIDTAMAIRDLYFPGDSLETLFKRCDDSSALTVAEVGHIMQHTAPGEVMEEMQWAVFSFVNNKVERLLMSKGVCFAMGWCLAIGRAAGVREERARKRGGAPCLFTEAK